MISVSYGQRIVHHHQSIISSAFKGHATSADVLIPLALLPALRARPYIRLFLTLTLWIPSLLLVVLQSNFEYRGMPIILSTVFRFVTVDLLNMVWDIVEQVKMSRQLTHFSMATMGCLWDSFACSMNGWLIVWYTSTNEIPGFPSTHLASLDLFYRSIISIFIDMFILALKYILDLALDIDDIEIECPSLFEWWSAMLSRFIRGTVWSATPNRWPYGAMLTLNDKVMHILQTGLDALDFCLGMFFFSIIHHC